MIHKMVEKILSNDERSRNSDKWLILKVWESQGLYLTEAQSYKFFSVASPETIRRIRQKLQESGKYQPTDTIKRERRFRGMRMQQISPKATPKYMEQTLL